MVKHFGVDIGWECMWNTQGNGETGCHLREFLGAQEN
jgi:hypothetical protein